MKKISCLILAVALMLCFCACKDTETPVNNTTGENVDENTVSVVNDAYDATENLLKTVEKLGFELSYSRNLTYGEESDVYGIAVTYNFVGKGEGRQFLYETDVKYGDQDQYVMMYSDGKNIYGYTADTTYLVVNDKETNDYINEIAENVTVFNAAEFDVTDTVIMNTSSGGRAFVLTYDVKTAKFDPLEVFGPLYAESETDYELKPTSLKVSGIINADGKIVEQTVSYEYSYEYEDMTGVDPDNSEAQGVTKTATVKLEAVMKYNYAVESISAPSEITIVNDTEDEDNSTDEVRELSLTDFLKLGTQSTDNK